MNRVMTWLLQSRLHWLVSSRVQLIRYHGRRTGRTITLPTQYVEMDDGSVGALVGRPRTKLWWRNFEQSGPVELCIRRRWRGMSGRAFEPGQGAESAAAMRQAFAAKYGRRAAGVVSGDADVVVVVFKADG